MNFPKVTKEQRLKARIERLKLKAKEKKELRISDLKKIVQRKVNAYVRERDKDEPCISCGKYFDNKDAGHYVSQGSSGFLRYRLDNIHGQCRGCNSFKHGNLIEYRMGLIARIGEESVKDLERLRNAIKKYTKEELQAILLALK